MRNGRVLGSERRNLAPPGARHAATRPRHAAQLLRGDGARARRTREAKHVRWRRLMPSVVFGRRRRIGDGRSGHGREWALVVLGLV